MTFNFVVNLVRFVIAIELSLVYNSNGQLSVISGKRHALSSSVYDASVLPVATY